MCPYCVYTFILRRQGLLGASVRIPVALADRQSATLALLGRARGIELNKISSEYHRS